MTSTIKPKAPIGSSRVRPGQCQCTAERVCFFPSLTRVQATTQLFCEVFFLRVTGQKFGKVSTIGECDSPKLDVRLIAPHSAIQGVSSV
ncbi:hypothetical protein pipiens_004189 [Culex pipiens pipiens]|uniref:Uncharacterized protein n=1 Tax=Culex pipiens pipiens TaxID=38569 RepID=A0ABD1CMN8_CULPP